MGDDGTVDSGCMVPARESVGVMEVLITNWISDEYREVMTPIYDA
jgi:hypothetical protein